MGEAAPLIGSQEARDGAKVRSMCSLRGTPSGLTSSRRVQHLPVVTEPPTCGPLGDTPETHHSTPLIWFLVEMVPSVNSFENSLKS